MGNVGSLHWKNMMNRPVFKRVSPTYLGEDGYHHLIGNWIGSGPHPLFAAQHLGAIVKASESNAELSIFLQAFHADGQKLTSGSRAVIPPNRSVTYDFGLLPFHLEQRSSIIIRATPEADPSHPEELVLETFPGLWAMFGGDVLNPLPKPAEINALEAQTGHPLCEDHRRFLETRNGIDFAWWNGPEWSTSQSDDMDFFAELSRLQEKMAPGMGLLIEASHLFGAGNGHPYLSFPDNLGDFGFYHPEFLRFGLPVGDDAGGNLYVQILDGTRRGEVVFLDHEYHFGLLDNSSPPQFVSDIRESGPDKPLQEFSADEFWALMAEIGYALPLASGIDQMIEKLTAHHNALISALAPKWRKS